jgi:hypothetical protein
MTGSSILGSPQKSADSPLLSFLSSQSPMVYLGIAMAPKIFFSQF